MTSAPLSAPVVLCRTVGCWVVVAMLAACGSGVRNNAPVEDRGGTGRGTDAPVSVSPAPGVRMPPGFENAGKPGFYTVKPGDTLIGIGLDQGQAWRDLQRWNGLENPNRLDVGQVLRVVPPLAPTATPSAAAAVVSGPNQVGAPAAQPAPVATGAAVTRPVTGGSAAPSGPVPPVGTPSAAAAAPVNPPASGSTAAAPARPGAVAPAAGGSATGVAPPVAASNAPGNAPTNPPINASSEDEPAWLWPAAGAVLAGFDEARNKGVDIAGQLGDPVLAAADGRVVYAGAGLRGYGNLVILKHNNTYLTAYAHNQSLLVKEDQTVRRGQRIAEMGNTDADRVKLHFEIRRQGKPVDPLRYLPNR